MRPVRLTVGGLNVSAPIPMDPYQNVFNASLAVVLSAGASLTYTVQYTFDDIAAPNFNPATATWFSHATLVTKTASSDGNFLFPVTAVRLNVGVYVSGTATLTVIQVGMPGR